MKEERTMPTISAERPVVTLINVFDVEPERQQDLVELLVQATDKTMRHLPGFVSASIHQSLDARRVANYAQWRSTEDFKRMLQNPEAQDHMNRATKVASAEPNLYHVVSVHE